MKFRTILAVCLIAMVVVASARTEVPQYQLNQSSPSWWDSFMSVVNSVISVASSITTTAVNWVQVNVVTPVATAVNTYVIAPAINAVNYVQQTYIAPQVNNALGSALNLAASTLCSSVIDSQTVFTGLTAAQINYRCNEQAAEEIAKYFNYAVW